ACATTRPSGSTTPPRTFVPPMSTPKVNPTAVLPTAVLPSAAPLPYPCSCTPVAVPRSCPWFVLGRRCLPDRFLGHFFLGHFPGGRGCGGRRGPRRSVIGVVAGCRLRPVRTVGGRLPGGAAAGRRAGRRRGVRPGVRGTERAQDAGQPGSHITGSTG